MPITYTRLDYQFTPPDGSRTITQAVEPRQNPAFIKGKVELPQVGQTVVVLYVNRNMYTLL